jgi:hypothetical protein
MKTAATGANRENRERAPLSLCAPVQIRLPYLRQSASICGQFRIWLRRAALGLLCIFAAILFSQSLVHATGCSEYRLTMTCARKPAPPSRPRQRRMTFSGNASVTDGRARLRRAETRFPGKKSRLDRVSPYLFPLRQRRMTISGVFPLTIRAYMLMFSRDGRTRMGSGGTGPGGRARELRMADWAGSRRGRLQRRWKPAPGFQSFHTLFIWCAL